MIPALRSPRVPGRLLLRVARLVFTESVLSEVVVPTIADLQQEVREAGADRIRRRRARWRGYRAFWRLVVRAPFAFRGWPVHDAASATSGSRSSIVDGAFTVIVAMLVLSVGRFTGWWLIAGLVGGGLVAVAIRQWHNRHPSEQAMPLRGTDLAPSINLSRIPVDGNAGGLIYVIGSVVIGMLGLPMLRWFFPAAFLGGLLGAALLRAWRRAHASRAEHPLALR